MKKQNTFLVVFLFVFPFFILYTIFTILPIFQGMIISLSKWGLMGKQKFVGFENYFKAFKDKYFVETILNTLVFVILTVPSMIIVSFSLAYWANREVRYKRILRICYYLPSVLSVSVISVITVYMASPYMGFVNQFLHHFNLIGDTVNPQWLLDIKLAWLTIVSATVWWTTGFSMLLFIAGLQDIPSQLYEVADLDGASSVRKLFSITIPILKPIFLLVFFLQVVGSFKVFGQIYLTTKGGPGTATRPIIQYIYQTAFVKNKFGYGAAMSYLLFLILLVFTIFQLKYQRNMENK